MLSCVYIRLHFTHSIMHHKNKCSLSRAVAQVDKYVTHGHMISQCITRNIQRVILLTHARHDMLIILLIIIIWNQKLYKQVSYLVASCFFSPFSVRMNILCLKLSEKRTFYRPNFFSCEGLLPTRLIQEFEAISFEIVIYSYRLILEIDLYLSKYGSKNQNNLIYKLLGLLSFINI